MRDRCGSSKMSLAQLERKSSSLCIDLFYDILRRLDGATLARAACVCAAFSSISKEERIWENVCYSLWPSLKREDVRSLISVIGGFRKFYADCFPLIVNKDLNLVELNPYTIEYPEEWPEPDFYDASDEYESITPSDFLSMVDVWFKDKPIFSEALWGMPDSDGFNRWFYNSPFRIDLIGNYSDMTQQINSYNVILSVADGLPEIQSIESEKKEGKLWKELLDGIRLSWIIVNQKVGQAANISSWIPLGVQRHWPTEDAFLMRFGSVLPSKDILPCQSVECILVMKFRMFKDDSKGGCISLKLTQLSLQLEDMEGAHVNGRNSLLILKEALSSRRSKNYSEVLESCNLYSRLRSALKEEKMRNESRIDRLCILSGIAAFTTFLYCIL